MSALSVRPAFTALALGIAVLGAGTLTSGEAAAKGLHGGWGRHHHGAFHGAFHGGFGLGVGFGAVGYAPAYAGVEVEDEPEMETCYVRRVVTASGRVVRRTLCE